ncbi:MAG: hypothetical protein J1F64_08400 [Oscillospiraceae bacterium]|nr:hypothetical protein [Oscillospiraceae bacterium]
MHELEKELIFNLGVLDMYIESISVDDWFENARIVIDNEPCNTVCIFKNCFEIYLDHDKTYSKGKKKDGNGLNYKYFIQDIGVKEDNGFFEVKISAWPFESKIVCREFYVDSE